MSEFVASFLRPRLLLLSSCRCRCRRCRRCCPRHCHHCRVIVRRVYCCHRHPSQLLLDPRSLLLPPHHCTLLMPSNFVFIVHCACHYRLPSLQTNTHARCHHPPPPLLNAIFADVTLPPQSNAVKHCHPIKYPCLMLSSSITNIKCCRPQMLMLMPATNTCQIQTLSSATTTQGYAMPLEVIVLLSPRPWIWTTLFRDDVSCLPS